MSAPVCIHCAGWACTRCSAPSYENISQALGEQGLSAAELEVIELRAQLVAKQVELVVALAERDVARAERDVAVVQLAMKVGGVA